MGTHHVSAGRASLYALSLLLGACSSDTLIARDTPHTNGDAGVVSTPLDGGVDSPDTGVAPPTISAFVQACDTSTPSIPNLQGTFCEGDGWCWDSPSPMGRQATSITRSGSDLVVATRGGLIAFDGTDWKSRTGPLSEPEFVWSPGDANLFVANAEQVAHFDGTTWKTWQMPTVITALDGSATNDVWLLLSAGGTPADTSQMMRFDGTAWTRMDPPPPPVGRLAVSSPRDAWVYTDTNDPGTVSHFDGATWTNVPTRDLGSTNVTAFWAAAPNDAWIGTTDVFGDPPRRDPDPLGSPGLGSLFHWDGTSLAQVSSPTCGGISAIWGKSPTDIWFGTVQGEYLHWNGTRMSAVESPTSLNSIVGFAESADGRLFAAARQATGVSVTATGSIVEYSGGKWIDHSLSGTTDYAKAVWGSAWNDVWAVGTRGLRLHFDGRTWTNTGTSDIGTITGIWGSSRDDVWTVTDSGNIDHFDGTSWAPVYGMLAQFTDVWGIGNGEIWVTGSDAENDFQVGRLRGTSFEKFKIDLDEVRVVWASSTTDVWVGGAQGVRRFDGVQWNIPDGLAPPPLQMYAHVSGIWGTGPNDVWVSLAEGHLAHYDGHTFGPAQAPIPISDTDNTVLWGCGHELFMADGQGIAHFDGTNWSFTPMYTQSITGLWAASPNFAIAVGWGGQVIRKSQ